MAVAGLTMSIYDPAAVLAQGAQWPTKGISLIVGGISWQ